VSVIKKTPYEDVTIKEIYFSGRDIKGKRPRGYGVLAESFPGSPLVVVIGDTFHKTDEGFLINFARKGYSVFMFDYTGEDGVKTKCTIYPQEIDFANLNRAGRHLYYAEPDARSTSLFEWTLLSYYAISAAHSVLGCVKTGVMGIGKGADIVWMLSVLDKRLSACVTAFRQAGTLTPECLSTAEKH
jgi:cephalosporin-C deacetylase-like acetyl esterase